jgi:beta-lactamase class A
MKTIYKAASKMACASAGSIACLLLFTFLTTSCSGSATTHNENQPSNLAHSQIEETDDKKAKTDDKQTVELRRQIEQIAAVDKGRVGMSATVLETGQTVSLNSTEHFPMQSVYKLPIGMTVLQQIDAGKIKLEQKVLVEKDDFVRQGMRSPIRDENPNGAEITVKELLRFAVSESDGTASDALLELVGGSEAVGKYLNELKVNEMVVADSEKIIGRDWYTQYRNWASPDGAIALLGALRERRGGLSEQNQKLILDLMIASPTGPKRLKGLLPKDAVVAHKTGTSGTKGGITAATNDIGIVTLPNGRHLAIAVFVSDSPADEATREQVIAKIARAVWDAWSK